MKYWEKEHLVFVVVKGDQHAEEVGKALLEIVSFARQIPCNRFLFDIQESMVQDTLPESYDFIEGLEMVGLRRTDVIANIYKFQEGFHRFAEDMGVNRGWNVRYFKTRKNALQWLREFEYK